MVGEFYKITDSVPFEGNRAEWAFTDEMKMGESILVKNWNEVASIRQRMKKKGRRIAGRSCFGNDHEFCGIRIWRTK